MPLAVSALNPGGRVGGVERATSIALILVGLIAYLQAATPFCLGRAHTLPQSSRVLASYPCNGRRLQQILHILRRAHLVLWDFARMDFADVWVSVAIGMLVLRMISSFALPAKIHNQVLAPVTMYVERAALPAFHFMLGPGHRPSYMSARCLFYTYAAFDVAFFISLMGVWPIQPAVEAAYCAWSAATLAVLCGWYRDVAPGGLAALLTWQLASRLGVAAVTLSLARSHVAAAAVRRSRRLSDSRGEMGVEAGGTSIATAAAPQGRVMAGARAEETEVEVEMGGGGGPTGESSGRHYHPVLRGQRVGRKTEGPGGGVEEDVGAGKRLGDGGADTAFTTMGAAVEEEEEEEEAVVVAAAFPEATGVGSGRHGEEGFPAPPIHCAVPGAEADCCEGCASLAQTHRNRALLGPRRWEKEEEEAETDKHKRRASEGDKEVHVVRVAGKPVAAAAAAVVASLAGATRLGVGPALGTLTAAGAATLGAAGGVAADGAALETCGREVAAAPPAATAVAAVAAVESQCALPHHSYAAVSTRRPPPTYWTPLERCVVRVKIPWAEPEQLAPGFEQRISELAAERGLHLAGTFVRRGCVELTLVLQLRRQRHRDQEGQEAGVRLLLRQQRRRDLEDQETGMRVVLQQQQQQQRAGGPAGSDPSPYPGGSPARWELDVGRLMRALGLVAAAAAADARGQGAGGDDGGSLTGFMPGCGDWVSPSALFPHPAVTLVQQPLHGPSVAPPPPPPPAVPSAPGAGAPTAVLPAPSLQVVSLAPRVLLLPMSGSQATTGSAAATGWSVGASTVSAVAGGGTRGSDKTAGAAAYTTATGSSASQGPYAAAPHPVLLRARVRWDGLRAESGSAASGPPQQPPPPALGVLVRAHDTYLPARVVGARRLPPPPAAPPPSPPPAASLPGAAASGSSGASSVVAADCHLQSELGKSSAAAAGFVLLGDGDQQHQRQVVVAGMYEYDIELLQLPERPGAVLVELCPVDTWEGSDDLHTPGITQGPLATLLATTDPEVAAEVGATAADMDEAAAAAARCGSSGDDVIGGSGLDELLYDVGSWAAASATAGGAAEAVTADVTAFMAPGSALSAGAGAASALAGGGAGDGTGGGGDGGCHVATLSQDVVWSVLAPHLLGFAEEVGWGATAAAIRQGLQQRLRDQAESGPGAPAAAAAPTAAAAATGSCGRGHGETSHMVPGADVTPSGSVLHVADPSCDSGSGSGSSRSAAGIDELPHQQQRRDGGVWALLMSALLQVLALQQAAVSSPGGEAAAFESFQEAWSVAQGHTVQLVECLALLSMVTRSSRAALHPLVTGNLVAVVGCAVGTVTTLAWLVLPYRTWVRLVRAARVPRYAGHVAAKALVALAGLPAPPGIVSYGRGVGALLLEGLILPVACLLSPRSALLVAAVKLPLNALMFSVIGSAATSASAVLLAARIEVLALVTTLACHVYMRVEYERRGGLATAGAGGVQAGGVRGGVGCGAVMGGSGGDKRGKAD